MVCAACCFVTAVALFCCVLTESDTLTLTAPPFIRSLLNGTVGFITPLTVQVNKCNSLFLYGSNHIDHILQVSSSFVHHSLQASCTFTAKHTHPIHKVYNQRTPTISAAYTHTHTTTHTSITIKTHNHPKHPTPTPTLPPHNANTLLPLH